MPEYFAVIPIEVFRLFAGEDDPPLFYVPLPSRLIGVVGAVSVASFLAPKGCRKVLRFPGFEPG